MKNQTKYYHLTLTVLFIAFCTTIIAQPPPPPPPPPPGVPIDGGVLGLLGAVLMYGYKKYLSK